MTTLGPTLVHECPSCKGAFKQRTIATGNTSRAEIRSDGRLFAPMLPLTPPIVACPHCNAAIGIFDLEPIATFDTCFSSSFLASEKGDERDIHEVCDESEDEKLALKYEKTPLYVNANAGQYFNFLDHNQLKPEVEQVVRQYAFWTSNDEQYPDSVPSRFRSQLNCLREINKKEPLGTDGSHAQRIKQNIEALLRTMHDSVEDGILIKADMLRQLGRFEEALRLLDDDFESAAVAEQITREAEQHKSAPILLAGNYDSYEFEYAWMMRRYSKEEVSVPLTELKPPLFKINNRNWYVKVLGMLNHNWALIEENLDGTATAYFFQDHAPNQRPAVIDSITFSDMKIAWTKLNQNDFTLLQDTPGPWMGCAPKGFFYDSRPESGTGIYSSGKYWKDDNNETV